MKTARYFEVHANGTTFGAFLATDEQQARDLCAQEAGYKDEADMAATLGTPSELVAHELNIDRALGY